MNGIINGLRERVVTRGESRRRSSAASSPVVTGAALADAGRVGNKFARQAAMLGAGLPVPPFFCLGADAFVDAVAPHRERIRLALAAVGRESSPAEITRISATLRELVESVPVPDAVVAAILDRFDRTFGADGRVAVRSSMVAARAEAAEDSEENPFAGIGDSFLYVRREDLLAAVRACWSSAFTPEGIGYRIARCIDPTDVAVAVGVQEMLPGRRSFVLFTCDPRTGGRDPVIAAGFGIGEGVVAERVAVDHYFYTRATASVTSEIARKDTMLGPSDAGGARFTLAESDVPAEARERPCLSGEEIRAIVALGDRAEALFGGAQDVEGTITADGTIHLVQARPVALDRRQRRLWSNANITESFPGVTTALTYSFARWFYDADFFDLYRRLGVGRSALRRNAPALPGMIGFVHGRVYYSLSEWHTLYRLHALFPAYRQDWERMMGLPGPVDDRPDRLVRDGESRLGAGLRLALPAAVVVGLVARHERSMREFEAWWAALIGPARARSLDGRNVMELAAEFRAVWAEVVTRWGITLVNDLLITTTQRLVSTLAARWLPGETDDLLPELLCGGEEPRSVSAVMSAVAIAEHVRRDARLCAALSASAATAVWPDVAAGRYGEELRSLFDGHLERYGDRGLQELKIEQPNTRDTPWLLLDLVGTYAGSDVTVADLRGRERAVRARAERRLVAGLGRLSPRRAVLRHLVDRLRRYIRYRENSRYSRSELFGLAKRIFHRMGAEMAAAGVLDDAADVVHLTLDELLGYAEGGGTVGDLAALAHIRRREFESPGPELPMNFATLGPVPEQLPAGRPRPRGGSADLRGLGSSPGQARGTACVVIEPTGNVDMPEDAILVARETDPGWLFLMLKARAIVVERGTLLSHTAITGRLFGIPTVVAVADATARIPDGAAVEVDGTTGTVRLLAAAG